MASCSHSREDIINIFAEFCLVTGVNEDEALPYLLEKNWKVVDAINLYFDTVANQPDDVNETNKPTTNNSTPDASGNKLPVQTEKKIKILSWNIDGLDERNLKERTKAVCAIIEKLAPEVVFLQEVVSETAAFIAKHCQRYTFLPTSDVAYFTAMMLKKSVVTCTSQCIEPFANTSMMRVLHKVQVKCAGLDLLLLNSHLESMKDHHKERKQQFRTALTEMTNAGDGVLALFGGDTNLRDSEVSSSGGLPGGIFDLWEMCGSTQDSKYTWDIVRNNNLNWPHRSKPRLRFDRLYLRQAKIAPQVLPEKFQLVGQEWISTVERFPSDHFGIVCDLKIK